MQKPISDSLLARVSQAAKYIVNGSAPDSWFGASNPIAPVAPSDVIGRRFDYPVGSNLNYTPRSSEPVSFEDLRALADNCDILRSVIETRKDQMEALDWNIRVKGSKTPTPEQIARMEKLRGFFLSPDKENGFSGWLRQILEDMFVIDAACLYKRKSLAGDLYALEVIDGATINILIDDSGRSPIAPAPAYQQVLKGVPACDYTRDELIYLKHNPRSHKLYGYSHVEQVMMTVNILIRRALYQLEYYREGSQPDAFIGLPKEWNQDQILAFQRHFDAMLAGNLSMRRRLRFMPGEFKYQETKTPPLKDVYDEFLARIICFVFSISPEPFVSQVNRATAESSQARAIDEGLVPLQKYVSSLMNRVITQDFSSPDLEFVWLDTKEQSPLEASQIDVAYVGAGIMTVAEVRERLGLGKLQSLGIRKDNPYHRGGGCPEAGQFCSADEDGVGGEGLNNIPFVNVDSAGNPIEGVDSSFLPEELIVGALSAPYRGAIAAIAAIRYGLRYLEGGANADASIATDTSVATGNEVEISSIVESANGTVGNDGIVVSSRKVAEDAAQEFVGKDARTIYDRTTGNTVGRISSDGTKIARYTSADKPAPYINLENKTTNGNLHIRWQK